MLRTLKSYLGFPQYGHTMDPVVWNHGITVAVIDLPKIKADDLCKELRNAYRTRVDWYYAGGRVVVKTLKHAGNIRLEIEKLIELKQVKGSVYV